MRFDFLTISRSSSSSIIFVFSSRAFFIFDAPYWLPIKRCVIFLTMLAATELHRVRIRKRIQYPPWLSMKDWASSLVRESNTPVITKQHPFKQVGVPLGSSLHPAFGGEGSARAENDLKPPTNGLRLGCWGSTVKSSSVSMEETAPSFLGLFLGFLTGGLSVSDEDLFRFLPLATGGVTSTSGASSERGSSTRSTTIFFLCRDFLGEGVFVLARVCFEGVFWVIAASSSVRRVGILVLEAAEAFVVEDFEESWLGVSWKSSSHDTVSSLLVSFFVRDVVLLFSGNTTPAVGLVQVNTVGITAHHLPLEPLEATFFLLFLNSLLLFGPFCNGWAQPSWNSVQYWKTLLTLAVKYLLVSSYAHSSDGGEKFPEVFLRRGHCRL